jgi:hypothetical protein
MLVVQQSVSRAENASSRGRVQVVVDLSENPRIQEASVRLVAELQTAGFEVLRTDVVGAQTLVHGQPETSVTQIPPLAIAFVVDRQTDVAIDLALPGRDHATSRRVIAVGTSAGLAPAALAVRAVEILSAHLIADQGAAPSATKPDETPVVTPIPTVPPERRWSMSLGATAVVGDARAMAPSMGIERKLPHRFALALDFAGPSSTDRQQGILGQAQVRQYVLRLGLRYDLLQTQKLGVSIGADVGAMGLSATGTALPPAEGRSDSAMAPVVGGGIGGNWRILERLGLALDLRGLWTTSVFAVDIAGERKARARLPILLTLAAFWMF